MPPGFTCVIKVKTRSGVKDAVSKINRITSDIRIQNILDSTPESGINHILFRCDPEEKDISKEELFLTFLINIFIHISVS